MVPEVSVYIATSLDGFIARRDDDLDWLDVASANVPDGEDCGYGAFMASVDVLVMGRRTFDKVFSFGQWPYESKRVVVLTSQPEAARRKVEGPSDDTVVSIPDTVSFTSDPPRELCRRLASEGCRHVYLDGGQTIQQFLAEGLVSYITVTKIPMLLGDGIPLFGSLPHDIRLELIPAGPATDSTELPDNDAPAPGNLRSRIYNFGFAQLTYRVLKAEETTNVQPEE